MESSSNACFACATAFCVTALENCQSLSKAERATVYAEAKKANPGAVGEEFVLAYRNALLKAGIEKGGTNHSGNLGQVDLSLFS